MADRGWTGTSLRVGVGFLTVALVLASCGAHHGAATPHAKPIATTFLDRNSICGSDAGDYVHQTLNGDFTACFRVPDLETSTDTVALAAYVSGTTPVTNEPTTTYATTTNDPLTLSISRTTVTPGETVTVHGRLQRPLSVTQPLPTLCWGGCHGLTEQGATPQWTSSTTFRMKLAVPETAWLQTSHGTVTVHPLTSGTYSVGIQCLTSISGCARGPAEARTSVYLRAPTPARCVSGKECETLTLSSTTATIGDQVLVKGWAPLQTTIGQPFSYWLSVTPGAPPKHYPSLAYGDNPKGDGGLNLVLTPRALHVEAGPTWASLGRVPYLSSTYSGTSGIDASTTSPLVAWCQPSGIVVTGGAATATVPTEGVRAALQGSPLRLYSSAQVVPQCIDVQLDPHFAQSLYAGFGTAKGNSIPPVYMAPMYTTNDGATWHLVPVPTGQSIENFSGFDAEGNSVAALFTATSNRSFPFGTNKGYVPAEVTSNGGLSWTSTTLGCAARGPCVTLGPYFQGYCNMSNQNQAILLGPSSGAPSVSVRWTTPSWPSSLNSCYPQQLVASSSHELVLLDPSSEYQMLISTDRGSTWTYRALPVIKAANYGLDSVPISNALVLAPDGSLFASVTTASGARQELFRLSPSASMWCEIPHAFGTLISVSGAVSPLRVNTTDLLWTQTVSSNSGAVTSTSIHAEALSKLVC